MKLLITLTLLCIMACAMNAQDFHGVSVTLSHVDGAVAHTITNAPTNQPLVGVILRQLDSNGVNPVLSGMDYGALAKGVYIQPGQSQTNMFTGNFKFANKITVAGKPTVVMEGEVTGYEILALLFADGTYYSPLTDPVDSAALFARVSGEINSMRSMARDTQYLGSPEERRQALQQHQFSRITHNASVDMEGRSNRRRMATVLLRMHDNEGPDAASAAIARLAAFPDVVKGE